MKKTIYIDNQCKLCHWSVRFIIRHDKKGTFSFDSINSKLANEYLQKGKGQLTKYESVVYQRHQLFYKKSDAVLNLLKDMGGVWKLFYVFIAIPKPIRDWLYDLIARNRYRLFEKNNYCEIPEIKHRFL